MVEKSLTAGETRPRPLMATVMNYFHFFLGALPYSNVAANVDVMK